MDATEFPGCWMQDNFCGKGGPPVLVVKVPLNRRLQRFLESYTLVSNPSSALIFVESKL